MAGAWDTGLQLFVAPLCRLLGWGLDSGNAGTPKIGNLIFTFPPLIVLFWSTTVCDGHQ
jgi:hypothetical protein